MKNLLLLLCLCLLPVSLFASHGIIPGAGVIYAVSGGADTTPPQITSATIDTAGGSPQTITYDTVASDQGSGSSTSFNITIGSNSNRVLVVAVAIEETDETVNGDTTISSITSGGSPMNAITYFEWHTDEDWTGLYYILAPAVGSNTIAITFSEVCSYNVGAISLYNVAQQAPEASNTASGIGTAASVALTTITDNAWIIDAAAAESSTVTLAEGSGQTSRYTTNTLLSFEGSTKPVVSKGVGGTSWTLSTSDEWGVVAAAFTPYEAASTSTLTLYFNEVVSQDVSYADAEILVDMSISGNDKACTYVSGDGTATWVFSVNSAVTVDDVCYLNFDENSSGDVIVDAADNNLAAITGTSQPITNLFVGVPDTTAPTVTTATINGTALTVNTSEVVVLGANPIAGEFLVDLAVTGNGISCSYVSGLGSTSLLFTTAVSAVYGETVHLRFDADSSGNIVEDAAGNDLAPISGTSQVVTNTTTQGAEYDEEYYVTQSGAGSHNGLSLENAYSVAEFNALSGDYTNDVFWFSGPISTLVTPSVYGTSGGQATLDGYKAGNCIPTVSECTSSAQLNQGMKIGSLSTGTGPEDYITVQDFRMTRTGVNDAAHSVLAPNGYSVDYNIFRRNYISFVDGQTLQFYNMRYAIIAENKTFVYGQAYNTSKSVNFTGMKNTLVSGNEFGHNESSYPAVTDSSEMIELHGCQDTLFEYNNIYGAADQSGLRPKEGSGGNSSLVIRFNKIHDNLNAGSGKGIHMNSDVSSATSDIYIYGNFIFNNGVIGISDGNYTNNVYIWSNLLINNGRHGFVTYGAGGNSGFYVYNNTFAQNGWQDSYDDDRGGIVLVNGSGFNIRNNILSDNRAAGHSGWYYQLMSTVAIATLEHNTHYHSLSTTNFDYLGALRSLATMQGTYNLEDDSPVGIIRNPNFTNPDGVDSTHGTVDDNYTLTIGSDEIDDATDLSFSKNVNVSGGDSWFETESGYSTISMTGNEALDPDTDWSGQPSAAKILILDRDVVGWDRGAYAYE